MDLSYVFVCRLLSFVVALSLYSSTQMTSVKFDGFFQRARALATDRQIDRPTDQPYILKMSNSVYLCYSQIHRVYKFVNL